MLEFILVVVFFTNGAVSIAGFSTQAECEAAGQKIQKQYNNLSWVKAICIQRNTLKNT